MRLSTLLLTTTLSLALPGAAFSDSSIPPVPPDYPSHKATSECGTPQELAQLQQSLSRYNVTRLEVAAVLRKMADKYALEGDARDGLLSFAQSFEQMQQHLPAPDPDSDEFRNFDFKLGLSFAALNVFLNTRDEALARHFFDDRKDPDSDLGLYLASLDSSRDSYMSSLKNANAHHSQGPGKPCR